MSDSKAPILGWRIDRADREALLARIPPRYIETVADHVTHGREDAAPPMPPVERATVIGRADDGAGVEALVVELAAAPTGGTDRPTTSPGHSPRDARRRKATT